ncbi:MAG: glycine zipper 2TM domain-containing protein, partial [Burkholderiales bacterium]|nr:glycine zipper 2TM domain-containing protein [Burkholderiales bacterium]
MNSTGFARTHPLILGAAASVLVVSLMAVASIGGLLPLARSDKADMGSEKNPPAVHAAPRIEYKPAAAGGASVCASCGTVESVRRVQLKGDATGLGAVAGGVTGAVVGNQMGSGYGNTAMTILGAAGGALAGNEIEKNMKTHYSYRVTVRMDDGSYRTVSHATEPKVAVGGRVRISNGA